MKKILFFILNILCVDLRSNLIELTKYNNIAAQSIEDKKVIYNLAKLYLNKKNSVLPQEALYQTYLANPEISLRAAQRVAIAIFNHRGKDNLIDNILDNIIQQLNNNETEILNKIINGQLDKLVDKPNINERIAHLKSKGLCEFKKSYHVEDTNEWADWTNTYKGLDIAKQKYCFEKYLTKALHFMLDYPSFAAKELIKYKKANSSYQGLLSPELT